MAGGHPLPHRYRASARGAVAGNVTVAAPGLPDIETEAPPEFGGPEGFWSPETLLSAAVADCYILSFRAAARASKLAWSKLDVDVEAVLEHVEGVIRFTRVRISPRLGVPAGVDEATALAVLHKAKRMCLVTNSLTAECELATQVYGAAEADVAG
jgi:organic hydroperoxide reductase OsmC/OhrA